MAMNRLKIGLRFLAHRWKALHPFEVQASLTNRCNFSCRYCDCPNVKLPELSTAQWLHLMRRLRSLGTTRFKFQGGEPTLFPDFAILASEAQRLGMISAVTTNGSQIAANPELLDHLDEVIVSLDSPHEEVHEQLRQKGSFGPAVKALELARQRRVKTYINMTISKINLDSLQDMLAFCQEKGFRFNAQPAAFGRIYDSDCERAIQLSNEETRRFLNQLAQWKRQGLPVLFTAQSYSESAQWDDYNSTYNYDAFKRACVGGIDHVHIEPNGDVYPCSGRLGSFSCKNIIKDGVEEALAHSRRIQCNQCWWPQMNERRNLFSLRWSAIKERLF